MVTFKFAFYKPLLVNDLQRNLEYQCGQLYISVSQQDVGEIVIHGADYVVGQTMPRLLHRESVRPMCDDDIDFCKGTISIPITNQQRSRYLNISTSTCLKSFTIDVFASKCMLH